MSVAPQAPLRLRWARGVRRRWPARATAVQYPASQAKVITAKASPKASISAEASDLGEQAREGHGQLRVAEIAGIPWPNADHGRMRQDGAGRQARRADGED